MIELKNLSMAYGAQKLFQDLSLTLLPGEHLALMGPSGCGKTTLLHILAGLIRPDSGTAYIHGRVTCVFQESALLPWLTAAQNINVVLSDRKETLSAAENWLKCLDLYEHRDKLPAALSGGQKQRVALLRALAFGGEILILDEAFKGLDSEARQKAIGLVRDAFADKSLVLATHDIEEARALCQRLLVYENGAFVEKAL